MAWLEFIGAGLVFLITHRVPTIPSVRAKIVNHIGERGFLIAYSTLSIMVLTWLIIAAGRAPYIEVWAAAAWQYWVPNIAMPIVCILIGFSVAAPNPLSFGGSKPETFDPNHPGFAGVTRHGLLWALALWSGSHIFPNGNLAHVILFCSFCAFSLLGMRIIDRRRQRQMGMDAWQSMAQATSGWPFQSLVTGRWKPVFSGALPSIMIRLLVSLALYTGLLMAHADVIGVSPLPVGGLS
jgi:uncharacterized membrane protein